MSVEDEVRPSSKLCDLGSRGEREKSITRVETTKFAVLRKIRDWADLSHFRCFKFSDR